MIVRPHGSTRLLITQPDHAALAGRIMRHWQADGFLTNPRQAAILTAIDQHDNGWREVDVAPLVDEESGRILDFVEAPAELKREVWPRGVRRVASTHYAAALVAQHGLHIYRRYRTERDWLSFFQDLEAERDRRLPVATATLDELLRDYLFVRVGDLISLTFCNGWMHRQADDSGSPYAIEPNGTELLVTPDPFDGARIPIEIAAREIPDRPFHSAADAHGTFEAAPVRMLTGIVRGGSS